MKRGLVYIFAFFAFSQLEAAPLLRIHVEPLEESEFVQGSLPFKEGDEWSDTFLSLSKKYLDATGRFTETAFRYDEKDQVLWIRVETLKFFDGIVYTKDKPKNRGDIQNTCIRTQEDRRLTQERISQISNCVVERVRGEGFLDAQAFVFPKEEKLAIELTNGPIYRVREIELRGREGVTSFRIRNNLHNKEGGAYRPLSINSDTKAITDLYFSNGYLRARVSEPTIQVDPNKREVKIVWRISENSKYQIEFLGDYTSRKPMERLRETGEPAPEWFLDDFSEMIRQDLASKGFLDAVVERDFKDLPNNRVRVRFYTTRGRQYLTTDPLWVGLKRREDIEKIYLQVSELRPGRGFGEERFRKAFEEQFFSRLIQNGFQEVRVRALEFSIDRRNYSVQPVVYMVEGPQRVIKRSRIDGMPEELKDLDEFDSLSDAIRSGKPYNALLIDELVRSLAQQIRANAYLDVTIEAKWEEKTDELKILIQPGVRYRVGDVIIRGLERTKIRVIQNQIQFKKGEYYSQQRINDTTAEILRLGLARSIDIQVFDKNPNEGSVLLVIEISEAARFRFEIGPGYGTADGIRGVLRGTYANIGGTGRRLSLYAKASRRLNKKEVPDDVIGVDASGDVIDASEVKRVPFLERRMTIEYFEPNLFVRSVDGRVVLKHELLSRRQYGVETYSVTSLFDWRPYRFLTYTPSYKVEYSDPFNIKIANETRPFDDTKASRLHSFGQRLLLSFVDDTFNPSKGVRFDTEANIYSGFLGSDDSFWVLSAEQAIYWPVYEINPKKKVGFAFSLNSGFSSEFDETVAIPVDKRFRLGGEASVRGFSEDGIQARDRNGELIRNGGKSVFYFRSELNIPIVGWVDLLGFFDGGNLYETNAEFEAWNLVDLRYGAGVGIRLNSPVGPVKLGYAFVLDRKEGEDIGQIYFGVGPL